MSKKVNIAIFPKVVLIIASVGCFVNLFLPWAINKSLLQSLPYSLSFFVPLALIGLITLILNIIAIATKSKGVNKAGNILGIIGGVALIGTNLLQLAASSASGLNADDYQVAFWVTLVLGFIFILFSIISMATSKIKKD